MGMTDPIADLLTRIRNGAHARKEQVDVPWSKVKARLVEVLTAEGFLKEHSIIEQDGHRVLRVWLKYDSQNKPGDRGPEARQQTELARLRRRA